MSRFSLLLLFFAYLANAHASLPEEAQASGYLKLTGMECYSPEEGVDCVAVYTFMPEGVFESGELIYKDDVITRLSTAAFDPQGHWCRYMQAPIACPGRAPSISFPSKLFDGVPLSKPQAGQEVRVYDRQGLLTWTLLTSTFTNIDDQGVNPWSLQSMLWRPFKDHLRRMGIDWPQCDLSSLPIFGVDHGRNVDVIFWPRDVDWDLNQGKLSQCLPKDLFRNVLENSVSRQVTVLCESGVRSIAQNPFAWETPLNKTELKWPARGNCSAETVALSFVNKPNNGGVVFKDGVLTIREYGQCFTKEYAIPLACAIESQHCSLTSGADVRCINVTARFSGSGVPARKVETFLSVRNAYVHGELAEEKCLECLFPLISDNLKARVGDLKLKSTRLAISFYERNDLKREPGHTVFSKGVKLNTLFSAYPSFKHKKQAYVDLTRFFEAAKDWGVGFFLDQITLQENKTGSARLVCINHMRRHTFDLWLKKTTWGLQCYRTYDQGGEKARSSVPFLILPMSGNKIIAGMPFSPMKGIRGSGDQVVSYLEKGGLFPQKPVSRKRLWAVRQYAQYIGRQTGMVLGNVALNLLCLPCYILEIFTACPGDGRRY